MIILGVDPGSAFTGYGLINYDKNEVKFIRKGIIISYDKSSMPDKIANIYNALLKVIKEHSPDEFAIETAFYGKNAQSALKIGLARAAAILAAKNCGLKTIEYSPREIKKAVCGNGAASKEQIQGMVFNLLALKKIKMKFDESDALAVAICHAFKNNSCSKKSAGWKEFVKNNSDKIIK